MTKAAARHRADMLMVERNLAPTRAKAQALILAGQVTSGAHRIDKPGMLLPAGAPLVVASRPRFVSRGGDKLEGAIEAFSAAGFSASGKICLDIGASTGGFTDCLLQRGAAKVIAVDVGYGQLAQKLRADPRVEVRERVNARMLAASDFASPIDLVVVDASFIGLSKLIEGIARLLPPGGELVALMKPQFEAGRAAVSRGRGVIRDETERRAAVANAREAVQAAGFVIVAEIDSAVHGPKGNVERFLYGWRTGSTPKSGFFGVSE